jgi:hypothetical protein
LLRSLQEVLHGRWHFDVQILNGGEKKWDVLVMSPALMFKILAFWVQINNMQGASALPKFHAPQ